MAVYQFYPYGKMNQSYAMRDENNEIVFEANLKKFHLFLACDYEFVNKLTGETVPHKVGKTVSTSTGSVTTSSYFKIDKQNVFDILDAKGLKIKFVRKIDLWHPEFDIIDKEGKVIAKYNMNSLAEKQEGVMAIGNKQRNVVVTAEPENIKLAFFGAFVLSRVDFSLYEI